MQWQGRRFHLPRQRQPLGFAGAKAQLHQTQEWNVAIYSEDMKIQNYDTGSLIFPRWRWRDIFMLQLQMLLLAADPFCSFRMWPLTGGTLR